MAHREFIDSKQIAWAVWDVYPARGDRRAPMADRRQFIREEEDRRTVIGVAGLRISPEYQAGWLAFQSGVERRRLAPVPPGWDKLDGPQLEQLCEVARPLGRSRRLVE